MAINEGSKITEGVWGNAVEEVLKWCKMYNEYSDTYYSGGANAAGVTFELECPCCGTGGVVVEWGGVRWNGVNISAGVALHLTGWMAFLSPG